MYDSFFWTNKEKLLIIYNYWGNIIMSPLTIKSTSLLTYLLQYTNLTFEIVEVSIRIYLKLYLEVVLTYF